MIDHILGRPSVAFRKTQVFAVLVFWTIYLTHGHQHGPPGLRRLSTFFSDRITAWQGVVMTMLYLYTTRNFGKVVGLECPEPLANLYTRAYFRATWITTALDAGFWTAMRIEPKWLRDICSMVFTVYYLVCAEQADEKVRKVRAVITLEHLRVSWDKPASTYLHAFTALTRPKLMKHNYPPRELRIARPQGSKYFEPIKAWLYFDGPLSELHKHDKIIFDIPGGGFVAQDPRCHDDKLIGWAGRTGLPVLAFDYHKAPEYPYPYALHEVYDAYQTIFETRGQCIGLSGNFMPKLVVSGDSAGGNLAVGLVLMILQSGDPKIKNKHGNKTLPKPDGLVLSYPALDMNMPNFITDEQIDLIKDRKSMKTNKGVIRKKNEDYRNLTNETPHDSDGFDSDKLDSPTSPLSPVTPAGIATPGGAAQRKAHAMTTTAAQLKTRLAMSSMISYFGDRILTPELMRAMIILYIGPNTRPDFSQDYFLSPILAPENLLKQFPKTFFQTGERDPLVDHTVIFAGRLRQAKLTQFRERQELGLIQPGERFREEDWVDVMLVPGISHAFLQIVSIFPEGWRYIFRAAKYMVDIFRECDVRALREWEQQNRAQEAEALQRVDTHQPPIENKDNAAAAGEDEEDDTPLEMPRISRPNARRTYTAPATLNGQAPRISPNTGLRRESSLRRKGDKTKQGNLQCITCLPSTDDLLDRRMDHMTGALTPP